jgi:hypothetical protein
MRASTPLNTSSMEEILSSVLAIMGHIKEVQQEIVVLSQQSSDSFLSYIQQKDETLSAYVMGGMQLQDIINQQLTAVVEAIDSIEKSVSIHLRAVKEDNMILNESFAKLHNKMLLSLSEAKKKQEAFIGHAHHHIDERHDDLEFF